MTSEERVDLLARHLLAIQFAGRPYTEKFLDRARREVCLVLDAVGVPPDGSTAIVVRAGVALLDEAIGRG